LSVKSVTISKVRFMVEEAKVVVVTFPGGQIDKAHQEAYARRLKYEKLIGRVVAKGDPQLITGVGMVLHTEPVGDVKITENTKIKLECRPYTMWVSGGINKGEFMEYNEWMDKLKKQYDIK